jgi:transcriptional regulator with XRE-family HTH domain
MAPNYKEIGEVLRQKRLELGKDVAAMAGETKILEKYIEALENGEIKEFPAQIYYGLFARSYAKELGLDGDSLFEKYQEVEETPKIAAGTTESISPFPIEGKKPQTQGLRIGLKTFLSFAAIIILAASVILFILIKGKTPEEETTPTEQPPAVTTQIEVDEGIPAYDTMAIESVMANNMAIQPLRLRIDVRADCWMELVSDGDTVIYDILKAGSSHEFKAINNYIISAGNPAGLELRMNDTLLTPLSRGGLPIKGFQITRDNAKGLYLIPGDSAHDGD